MTLDFRTKSIAIAGEGLTDDSEAVGAVERWYEVRRECLPVLQARLLTPACVCRSQTIGGVDSSKVESLANRIIVTFKSRPLAEKVRVSPASADGPALLC